MQFCFTIVPNFAVAHSRTIVSCGLRRRCADFSRWLLYDIKISILTGLRVSPGARAPGAHMTGAPVAIKLSGPSLRRRRSHQSSNSKNHILIRLVFFWKCEKDSPAKPSSVHCFDIRLSPVSTQSELIRGSKGTPTIKLQGQL